MRKRPILSCFLAFAVEVYTLSVVTHMCNLSKTVSEGIYSVLIMATFYLLIWLIIKKISKNKKVIVKSSFIILLIMYILNIVFYLEDYLL
mgnify:CR=1 FL=1